ncbi:MAG: A/G-specific adenine glycosylase [Pseudomonadota bacterium]
MHDVIESITAVQAQAGPAFAQRIIEWQRQHGRHGLPWQHTDAYCVWLSEIMLQQTQVATVVPYYQRFIAHFPDIAALATATQDQVLQQWSGLGYYSRARNLHRAAQIIMEQHSGIFPQRYEDILALPGIGRSTAGAISAFVFKQRCAILDGNVKRVLARYCAIEGYPGQQQIEAQLWRQAEALLPVHEVATYTQGLMDLGASICTRSKPRCLLCPLQSSCAAYQQGRIADLPTPRARKTLPERHSNFVLLLKGTNVLLEKRPDSGIWGGLWCPPQLDVEQDVAAYCVQQFNSAVEQTFELPMFTHTFTHFKLHMSPVCVKLAGGLQVEQPGRAWFDVENALQAAIPTPVRKIMLDLRERLCAAVT